MEEAENRKQRILAAALRIGGQRGLAATHMDEIAEAAGVSKGTLYNFYKSREQLLVEAVLSFVEAAVEEIPEVSDESISGEQRLQALIESMAGSFDRIVENFPIATQAGSLTPPGTEIHSHLLNGLNEIFLGYRKKIRSLLALAQLEGNVREDVDLNALAAIWVATYNGLLYRASFEESGADSLCTEAGVKQALSWLYESATEIETKNAFKNRAKSHTKDSKV